MKKRKFLSITVCYVVSLVFCYCCYYCCCFAFAFFSAFGLTWHSFKDQFFWSSLSKFSSFEEGILRSLISVFRFRFRHSSLASEASLESDTGYWNQIKSMFVRLQKLWVNLPDESEVLSVCVEKTVWIIDLLTSFLPARFQVSWLVERGETALWLH